MLVRVAQLYVQGKPVPRHRAITTQPNHVGRLSLFEQHDKDFRRSVVFAALHGTSGENVLPRLHDAVLRWIGGDCMTISGFEQDPVTHECRAQSWYIELMGAEAE